MDIKYLNLEFNGCKTKIELLNTPVAHKWLNAFNQYKNYFKNNNLDQDYKVESYPSFVHGKGGIVQKDIHANIKVPAYNITLLECVDKINQAIEDANACIEGKEFPYYAYVGMPWEQTNLIHRCFTTALFTNTNWKHNLTAAELIEYKKLCYSDKKSIFKYIIKKDFTTIDRTRLVDAIERINKWVHVYEGVNKSVRAVEIMNDFPNQSSLVLDWDSYNPSGEHTFSFCNFVSYEELKESFVGNYDEYDVTIHKFIAGKDYEFAYCEYDNPLEYDITNLDAINASLNIINDTSVKDLYKESRYIDWINDYNLEKEMYLPVPLGKVVENSCDFNSLTFDFNTEERWTNGGYKPLAPFNKVKSWISVGE